MSDTGSTKMTKIAYAIKAPEEGVYKAYMWWVADTPHAAWDSFFTFPSRTGERNAHRAPLATAIAAYEAIGYKCIKVKITEVEDDS